MKAPTLLLLTCALLFLHKANAQSGYKEEIRGYAVSLYKSFDAAQRIQGARDFNDSVRTTWNNLPVGLRPRAGVSIGHMTDDQRKLVHRILSASLSSQGYLKATGIMHLDELLNRYFDSLLYKKAINDPFYVQFKWSPKNYYFAFFGSPEDSIWGFKLEGHHLSVNFTFAPKQLSVTPFFVGTDPAEYDNSEYAGYRVLGQEEDLGIKLIHLLSPDQQKKAIKTSAVPGDIITAAESGRRLVENWGITGAEMNNEQKIVLQYIIREYVFNLEYEKATDEYNKILKAGIDKVYFGWIGATDEMKPHYFVLNGPTFLIEFDNNGGPRNGANHIHTIWREKGKEYGGDVLREHYLKEHK
jgi:hypothetical protein